MGPVMDFKQIPNAELDIKKIPSAGASLDRIWRFALTLNGYEHYDSESQPYGCEELATSRQARTLTELRASLFFEQRSWRMSGNDPGQLDMIYIRSLLWRIRQCVRQGLLD